MVNPLLTATLVLVAMLLLVQIGDWGTSRGCPLCGARRENRHSDECPYRKDPRARA